MAMTSVRGMAQLNFAQGTYQTDANAGWKAAPLWPDFAFYVQIIPIIYKAGAKAKRGRYDDTAWTWSSLTTLRAVENAGGRVEITGMEHVTALQGPCVFIGNHMSTLETFLLPVILVPFRPITFVVKPSLVTYPVFGYVMRSRDPIVVSRTNPREDLKAVLDGGCERLAKGMSIVIFPQTTRTPTFDPAEFNSIGVKLAKRANVPVVPLALKTDAWGNGRWLKDFGKFDASKTVHLAFGAPLRVTDRGAEEHDHIIRFITTHLKEWGGTIKEQ